jgi:hypothetical protein
MNNTKAASAAGIMIVCLLLVFLQIQGCAVASLARGKPGLDTSAIKPGMSMTEAETILGAHRREWTAPAGVRYRVYDYDGGVEGSAADAIAFAFLDVCMVGMSEIMYAIYPLPTARVRMIDGHIALSYDASDVVIGVFDNFGDFDKLLVDGHTK